MNRMGKADRRSRQDGSAFTLIELLVVIAIIMILAAILTPVVEGAFKKAKISRAHSEMATIVTAINAYANEYGVMPVATDNGYGDHVYVGKWGYDMASPNNPKKANFIYRILRGMDSTNNPKKMVFLEIPEASLKGECTLEGHSAGYVAVDGYFLDPWGNPYVLIMDTDGDGQIGALSSNGDDESPLLVYTAIKNYMNFVSPTKIGTFPGVRVGVMCFGPTPGDTNSFIASWR